MRVAYPYLRFSSPDQLEGDSIRRQTIKTTDWCNRKGVALDTTLSFEDLGRSAFTGSHFNEGALGVFFSLVKDGTIKPGSYLVIESLDRFSRENPMIAAGRLFELVKAGITVVTVDDEREYSPETLGGSDSTAMLILVIKMSQAHAESVRKSQLIGPAWQRKKELARVDRKPLTARVPEWLLLRDGRFVERWDRVEIVRRIFRETIEGFGRREIARRLNAEPAVPTFRAGENRKRPPTGWQTSSIAKIIQNRMVLGEYQPHTGTHRARNRRADGEPIKDFYPRIVDEETFWRAQAALKERRVQTSGRRGKAGAHILRGLAKCAECNGPMHIVNKGKAPKGGIYLRCDNHHRGTRCGNGRHWRVDYLEKRIIHGIASLDVEALSSVDDNEQEGKARLGALKAEVDDIETRRRRLLALVEGGDDPATTRYTELGNELATKLKMLKDAEVDIGSAPAGPVADRLSQAVALSNALNSADEDIVRETRIRLSALLRKIVSRIDCDPEMGAIMILPQRPLWRVKVHNFGLRMTPEQVAVLLDEDIRDDLIERFISFD